MKTTSKVSRMDDWLIIFYCFVVFIIFTLATFVLFLSPLGLVVYFIGILMLYLGSKSTLKVTSGGKLDKFITYTSIITPIVPVLALFNVSYSFTKYMKEKRKKYFFFSLVGLILIILFWGVGLQSMDFGLLLQNNQGLFQFCVLLSSIGIYKFYTKTISILER